MKKKWIAALLCMAMTAVSLAGCGSTAAKTSTAASSAAAPAAATSAPAAAATSAAASAASAAPAAAGNYDASKDTPVELIFTSVSVTGDSHTTAMTAFADKVKELSGGSVTCKVYSDGTLFTADNELDALLNGDADIAYLSFPTLATQKGLEWCSMIASGYFWSSYDHMTAVLNGDIGKNEIRPRIEKAVNCVPLSSFYLGAREVNTRTKQINSYRTSDGLLDGAS